MTVGVLDPLPDTSTATSATTATTATGAGGNRPPACGGDARGEAGLGVEQRPDGRVQLGRGRLGVELAASASAPAPGAAVRAASSGELWTSAASSRRRRSSSAAVGLAGE